jgi:ligand-binding sensor domain-containing protein
MYYFFCCFLLLISLSTKTCTQQEQIQIAPEPILEQVDSIVGADLPIADYIRNLYQDKNGHFWMGTNGYGVAHYNGETVDYYSNAQGFNGQQITGIAEDLDQNIWFSTDQGVVKYEWKKNSKEKKQFVNYSYFGGKRFWSICADSRGAIWAGSEKGIYRYDGHLWLPFDLPYPEDISGDFITSATAWSIMEDSQGRMWFSTNGYGVYVWDGQDFVQYDKEDGLTDNSVDVILEDSNGHIWIGTRYGGVSRFNGKTFTNYNQQNGSIGNDEVCALYEDSKANVWLSSEGYGVYRYDRITFANYGEADGLDVRAVQTIFEDRDGRIWAGGGGGLFRLQGDRFIEVTTAGPW